MKRKRSALILAGAILVAGCGSYEANAAIKLDTKSTASYSTMYKYSTTIEKERPDLDKDTKKLISAYKKDPSQENYDKLRAQVEKNYDEVLEKKKAKLEELKETAKEQSKITEMEEIVEEMVNDRENRIDQTMLRFTDSRLAPGAYKTEDGYLPVMGAGENVYISNVPVTNEEYAKFVTETGYKAPENWANGKYTEGQDDYPVVFVSYEDAKAYCEWLSKSDDSAVYRLPSELEWELAAGHMPKDADMNTGGGSELTSVYKYTDTIGASKGLDFWGNAWEWTSTEREDGKMAVKGGAFDTSKTDCRTENRDESRNIADGYNNVGFRVIKEVK